MIRIISYGYECAYHEISRVSCAHDEDTPQSGVDNGTFTGGDVEASTLHTLRTPCLLNTVHIHQYIHSCAYASKYASYHHQNIPPYLRLIRVLATNFFPGTIPIIDPMSLSASSPPALSSCATNSCQLPGEKKKRRKKETSENSHKRLLSFHGKKEKKKRSERNFTQTPPVVSWPIHELHTPVGPIVKAQEQVLLYFAKKRGFPFLLLCVNFKRQVFGKLARFGCFYSCLHYVR